MSTSIIGVVFKVGNTSGAFNSHNSRLNMNLDCAIVSSKPSDSFDE